MYPTQAQPVTQVQPNPAQSGVTPKPTGTAPVQGNVIAPQTVIYQTQEPEVVGSKYKNHSSVLGLSR
jgi:hypothetical protein